LLASITTALWYSLVTTTNSHLNGSWDLTALSKEEFRQTAQAASRGFLFLLGLVAVIFGIGRLIHWLFVFS
jgi:hypothetical protein